MTVVVAPLLDLETEIYDVFELLTDIVRSSAVEGDTVTLNVAELPSMMFSVVGDTVIDVTSVTLDSAAITVTLIENEIPSLLEKVNVSVPALDPVILMDFDETETEQYDPPLLSDGRVPVVALDGE